MATRIKLRLAVKNGEATVKTEKIAFELEEGRTLKIEPSIPGFGCLADILGSAQQACRLELLNGGLRILPAAGSSTFELNGKETGETWVNAGDILTLSHGQIEFVEAPVPPKEEPTRVVKLPEATRVVKLPDATRVAKLPSSKEEKRKDKKQAAREPTHEPEPEVADHATEMILREQLARETREKGKSVRAHDQDKNRKPHKPIKVHWAVWIAVSLLTIGVSSELASWIAFGARFNLNPMTPGVFGVSVTAFVSAISGVFHFMHRFLRSRARFSNYLSTFAWYSLLLVPFSTSFYFPQSVVVFAACILASVWIIAFWQKYFRHLEGFLPISTSAWVLVLAVTFKVANGFNFEVPAENSKGADRAIASAPVPAAPVPEPVNVLPPPPAAAAPAAVNAAPAQAQAPAPAAQSTQTTQIDPMAKEQFFNAVKSGNIRLVKTLVDQHVIDPAFILDYGSSALHYAAAQGDLPMVQYFVGKRCNIDAQDAGGTTPLMWAVYHKHPEVVDFLIQKKANLEVQREGGDKAIDLAKRGKNAEIIKLLSDALQQRAIAAEKEEKKLRQQQKQAKKKSKKKRSSDDE